MATRSIERLSRCTANCKGCGSIGQEANLCVKSEVEFLASLLRLQLSGLLKSLGCDQGQLIEWYHYAKRSFSEHSTRTPFLWGLKLLDELAKVLFDMGQVTACNAEFKFPLITVQERDLLQAWLSPQSGSYVAQVKDLEMRSARVRMENTLSMTAAAYEGLHEARIGFTKIRQVGAFTWLEHSAEVYVIEWLPGESYQESELERSRIYLALAYLDGVSRFGVNSTCAQRTDGGYILVT